MHKDQNGFPSSRQPTVEYFACITLKNQAFLCKSHHTGLGDNNYIFSDGMLNNLRDTSPTMLETVPTFKE